MHIVKKYEIRANGNEITLPLGLDVSDHMEILKCHINKTKRTIFVATLNYKDKDYIIHYDFGYEYPSDSAEFQFLENNYACDCNRSLIIRKEYGQDVIPELDCGCDIELVNYQIEYWD